MGIRDWFKKKPKPVVKAKSEPRTQEPVKTEKQLATERGEPWVTIVSMDIDPNNLHQGAFELDWNDKFVSNLIRAGYQLKSDDTDADIVDRWFQTVCRNILAENFEQWQANQTGSGRASYREDLGDGKTGVS